jgi:two-component system, NtrC family, sensor kinase
MDPGNPLTGAESPLAFPGEAMLNQLPIPYWEGDALGRCRFVNRSWSVATGGQESPELPLEWVEGIHPEERKAVVRTLEAACQSGKPFELEYRRKHADGSYRWISDQGFPRCGPDGAVKSYLACFFDVHQRRTAETRCLRLGQLYQALGQFSRAAAQHPEPSSLFEDACRVIVKAGQFRLAWVGLVDHQAGIVAPVAVASAMPQLDSQTILALIRERAASVDPENDRSRGIVGRAYLEGQFMLCPDFQADERTTPWHDLAQEYRLRASAAFPIRVRGHVGGVLALYAEESSVFDSETVDLLTRVAEDLGVSLEHFDQNKRRLEMEGRLRASERLFAATLDTMNAAIAVLDEQGRILAVNMAWSDFIDVANPLVYGLGLGSDYREMCLELLGQKGQMDATVLGCLEVMEGSRDVFVGDYACLAPSRWYATTVSRFMNEGFQRVVLAHREITRHKLADERLRKSETLFRTIAENAVDLIALSDTTGLRLYFSPSYTTILGYSREELESQVALELVHPEDKERVRQSFFLIGSGGIESTSTEYRMVRKDGEWRRFESHLTAIPDELGGPMRVLVVGRDITQREAAERERQQMEVQVRHSQKLESIGQLAAGIAHEINTPTQYIGDNLRFIQDGIKDLFAAVDTLVPMASEASDPGSGLMGILRDALDKADFDYLREELPKAAAQSLEGVARVSKIVGAMKEFSHPGGEDKTMADLNRAIESTVTVSRNEWKYVAELALDLDPGLPPVPCLPSEINQVVLNLVVNAAHAIADLIGSSGQRGLISVRTRHEGEEAVIQVEDSGAGIPEAIRSRIFDPFFTTKEVGRGSGQGLAIAHAVVVDKHGGSIGFETAEGAGTVFTVRLPLRATPLKQG